MKSLKLEDLIYTLEFFFFFFFFVSAHLTRKQMFYGSNEMKFNADFYRLTEDFSILGSQSSSSSRMFSDCFQPKHFSVAFLKKVIFKKTTRATAQNVLTILRV